MTSSSELPDNEKSDRHMGVLELRTRNHHMTNILLPGTDSQMFRGTVSQGPVTAGDTTTGHLTAMATTNQQHHLANLIAPHGSQTRRRLTSTGRALAAMVLPVCTTLSGSEPINLFGGSNQVCPPFSPQSLLQSETYLCQDRISVFIAMLFLSETYLLGSNANLSICTTPLPFRSD